MKKKEQLLDWCITYVSKKREVLEKRKMALQDSLQAETKSSAGDKHETGRAMVQLEQEKLGRQLMELDKMAKVLQQVDIKTSKRKISLGSCVATETAHYFISISSGAVKTEDGSMVFCISASTPIAKAILGKEVGDKFVFNGNEDSIYAVD